MSTPAPSPSLHPTRRQLDELDALMERMLELPVNPAAEEANRPASDEPTLPQPEDAAPLGELASHGFVSYRTEENDASVMTHQSPFHFTVAKSAVVNPDSTNRIVITGTATGVADDGPPPPPWLWPAAGVNHLYDSLMGRLGAPGRIMRGTGRTLLGWIGLLLMAAALAWAVFDWLHWAG